MLDDRDLVEKFCRGDEEAFDELVLRYKEKIYRLCYQFTNNVEDAFDLSQEVFLRAFQNIGEFKKGSSFYTWLYRIAHNLCVDFVRQTKSLSSTQSEDPEIERQLEDHSLDPYRILEIKEVKKEISRALSKLPPKTRVIFLLRYFEGLDYKSISEILGCNVNTIKAKLFHGRRALRRSLSRYLKQEPVNMEFHPTLSWKGSIL